MAPQLSPITLDPKEAVDNEVTYVHDVYNSIADHFSQTRYKPWPLIQKFLESLPPGAIGLDSGTGNGKYLPLDRDGAFHIVGLDRSLNLLKIARRAGGKERDVVLGDALGLGWRREAFDFAISIATIHHLSTIERRCEAIKALIRCVNPPGGRVLIYVWAVEQDELSKRVVPDGTPHIITSSDSDQNIPKAQDVLVPWVRAATVGTGSPSPHARSSVPPEQNSASRPQVFQRYYHLFAVSELTDLTKRAAEELGLAIGPRPQGDGQPNVRQDYRGVEIVADGWERSNYYVELRLWTR